MAITSVDVGRHDGFDRVVFRRQRAHARLRRALRHQARRGPDRATAAASPGRRCWPSRCGRPTGSTRRRRGSNATPRLPGAAPGAVRRRVRGASSSYGIGQATKAGFRVYRLTGPDRLVVDVRHPPAAAATRPAAAEPAGTAGRRRRCRRLRPRPPARPPAAPPTAARDRRRRPGRDGCLGEPLPVASGRRPRRCSAAWSAGAVGVHVIPPERLQQPSPARVPRRVTRGQRPSDGSWRE